MAIDLDRLVDNLTSLLKQRFPRKACPKVDTDFTTEVGEDIYLKADLGGVMVTFQNSFPLQHIQPRVQDNDARKTWTSAEPNCQIFQLYVGAINEELDRLLFTLHLPDADHLKQQLDRWPWQSVRELSGAMIDLRLNSPNGVYDSHSSEEYGLTSLGLTSRDIRDLWRDSQAGQKIVFRQWT